jgi:hypothetical protein
MLRGSLHRCYRHGCSRGVSDSLHEPRVLLHGIPHRHRARNVPEGAMQHAPAPARRPTRAASERPRPLRCRSRRRRRRRRAFRLKSPGTRRCHAARRPSIVRRSVRDPFTQPRPAVAWAMPRLTRPRVEHTRGSTRTQHRGIAIARSIGDHSLSIPLCLSLSVSLPLSSLRLGLSIARSVGDHSPGQVGAAGHRGAPGSHRADAAHAAGASRLLGNGHGLTTVPVTQVERIVILSTCVEQSHGSRGGGVEGT